MFFEERKNRAEKQLDLLIGNIKYRHQTVINLAVLSLAIVVLSNLLTNDVYLKAGVAVLLILNLVCLWYDIIMVRKAIENSTNTLSDILGKNFEEEVYKKTKKPSWVNRNFPEIACFIFSLTVIYFLSLLFKDYLNNFVNILIKI